MVNVQCDLWIRTGDCFQVPWTSLILLQTSNPTHVCIHMYTHTSQRFFIKDYLSHTHSENLQRTWLRNVDLEAITETALQPCARNTTSRHSGPSVGTLQVMLAKNLYLFLASGSWAFLLPFFQSRFLGQPASLKVLHRYGWLEEFIMPMSLLQGSGKENFKLLPQSGDVSQQKKGMQRSRVVRVTKSWSTTQTEQQQVLLRQLLGIRFTTLGVQSRVSSLLPLFPD